MNQVDPGAPVVAAPPRRPLRVVLFGDGESPHLTKWARGLSTRVELHVASSRGFSPAIERVVPAANRFALGATVRFEGGNVHLLARLPALVRWLNDVRPDWVNAHYLTSHGVMAWLASIVGPRFRLVVSAWGSDVLVAPERSRLMRLATKRVLRGAEFATSDSEYMARRMRALGARDVVVFPFGLEDLPPEPANKDDRLFFSNRGHERIYRPDLVLDAFAEVRRAWPDARLAFANAGSLTPALESRTRRTFPDGAVTWLGRLDADAQSAWYDRARWYVSMPASDSMSVSVLEAMAHGCIPLLSDLPANRELVRDSENGLIASVAGRFDVAALDRLAVRADEVARANRAWVADHALFPRAMDRFVERLSRTGRSEDSQRKSLR